MKHPVYGLGRQLPLVAHPYPRRLSYKPVSPRLDHCQVESDRGGRERLDTRQVRPQAQREGVVPQQVSVRIPHVVPSLVLAPNREWLPGFAASARQSANGLLTTAAYSWVRAEETRPSVGWVRKIQIGEGVLPPARGGAGTSVVGRDPSKERYK